MWRSADGQSWTEVPYPAPDGGTYDVMALSGAADGSYVFHAHDLSAAENSVVSLRSSDGETWKPIETGLSSDLYIQAIEEGPGGYLLVAGQGMESNPTLWLSSDALTWELVHEFSQDQQYVQLQDGDGGAEGYVVIGRRTELDSSSYERFAIASSDGREWTETAAPFGPDDQEFVWDVAVSSHGGDWLATLGDRNDEITLWSSADGLAVDRVRHAPGTRAQLGQPGPLRGGWRRADPVAWRDRDRVRHAGDLVLDRWGDVVTGRPWGGRLARRARHR